MYEDDEEFEDEFDDGFEDDEEMNDDMPEEDSQEEGEESQPAPQNEADIDEKLEELDRQQSELDAQHANFRSHDPDEQDAEMDNYLKKRQEIKEKKEDLQAAKAGVQINRAPDMKKMKSDAVGLWSKSLNMIKCPTCKQRSMFTEPAFSMAWKSAASYFIGKTRTPRLICLNPRCKSYYMRTGDTFVPSVTGSGLDKKKNPFFIPRK